MPVPVLPNDQTILLQPILNVLRPKECSGAIENTIAMMPMLVQMVSHNQKSHVQPHSDPLDIRNAMLQLTALSISLDIDTKSMASQETNINANSIMWYEYMFNGIT